MSEIELKIRANLLEEGDLFIKQGTKYRVVRIKDGKIFYDKRKFEKGPYIYQGSMEWVMWVGKYQPQQRKPAKTPKRNPNPKKTMIPVLVTTKQGDKIGEFRSIKQAAQHLEIDYKYIERYVKKELVKEKHPYHFEKIIVT